MNIIGIEHTQNAHELAQIYSAADIYVNASKEESFGLTMIEAMACGTPVIVAKGTACEEIAKNVHEMWAAGRMRDGWSYGEVRNDLEKQHPCLVPYEDLTETEKAYDRNTSQETLKLIVKLGFKLVRE